VLTLEVSVAGSIELNIEERSKSTLLEDATISADDLSNKSHLLVKKNSVSLAREIVARTTTRTVASTRTLGDVSLERHAAVRNAGIIRASLDIDFMEFKLSI